MRLLKEKITTWDIKTKEIINKLDPFTFEEFRKLLYDEKPTKVPHVYYLFDKRIEEQHSNGKKCTSRIYCDAKDSLQRFRKNLHLMEVTPDFLRNYERQMLEEGKSITAISMYIRHLRCIYNHAIDA